MGKRNTSTGRGMQSLRLLLSAASSFSLTLAGHLPFIKPAIADYTQSRQQTDAAAQLAADIGQAGGGELTAENIGAALRRALSAKPDAAPDVIAAALNRLLLSDDTLTAAIAMIVTQTGWAPSDLLSRMYADTYATDGVNMAQAQLAQMGALFGEEVMNAALDRIETAAGDEDAGGDLLPVYDG